MESKKIMILVLALSIAVFVPTNAFATGLKVNLSADANDSGNGEYCVHGGGETICQNSNVPGEVQVQFDEGDVGDGDTIKGCVDFGGNTECDTGTNTDCKCPENLHVSFEGNERDSSSSSAASSSSSSSTSSSSASSSIGDIIINNLRD